MEKERFEMLVIDYIDGQLDPAARELVERELRENPEARRVYAEMKEVMQAIAGSSDLEPSTRLRDAFTEVVESSVKGRPAGKAIRFTPAFYRVAAAIALMVISGAIGFWISRHQQQQERLLAVEREVEETRRQLQETRQQVFGMLGDEQSASQRIKGVNVALEMSAPDPAVVSALFRAMASDPNTNVRLAALEALAKFSADAEVRQGLIAALGTQEDPMVQIGLIQILVQLNEKEAVKDLKQIVDDEGAMKAVKDEAYIGILKLS